MSICTSRTASIDFDNGVSCVLCTGFAVFTSTSHSVSAAAGMGFFVCGCTFDTLINRVVESFQYGTDLFLLEHLNEDWPATEGIALLVQLGTLSANAAHPHPRSR